MITCPECQSTDVRFRIGDCSTLTVDPPIHSQGAYCVACGCEWTEMDQTWEDRSDYNPNQPTLPKVTHRHWQQVMVHGGKKP